MKKTFIGIMALAISLTAFVSCELDAPEINFSHTTNVEVNFDEVLNAINSMEQNMETRFNTIDAFMKSNAEETQKLAVMLETIKSTTLAMDGKVNALKDAVDQGFVNLKSVIDGLSTEFDGIEQLIKDEHQCHTQMLAALTGLKTLIEGGFGGVETLINQAVDAIKSFISTENAKLDAKLDLIDQAIKDLNLGSDLGEELTEDALLEELGKYDPNTNHWTHKQETVDDINKTLAKLGFAGSGIKFGYDPAATPGNNVSDSKVVTIDKDTWADLTKPENKKLYDALGATMGQSLPKMQIALATKNSDGVYQARTDFGMSAIWTIPVSDGEEIGLYALYHAGSDNTVKVAYIANSYAIKHQFAGLTFNIIDVVGTTSRLEPQDSFTYTAITLSDYSFMTGNTVDKLPEFTLKLDADGNKTMDFGHKSLHEYFGLFLVVNI